MAVRNQHFPVINFATMKDGDTSTVPFSGDLQEVLFSASARVLFQRSQKREVTYAVNSEDKTITFTMLSNTTFGGKRLKAVASIQGRRAPSTAVAVQKLTQRERMLRSFWREAYLASLGYNNAEISRSNADNAIKDYDDMLATRDAKFTREGANV